MKSMVWLREQKLLLGVKTDLRAADAMHYLGKRRTALALLIRMNQVEDAGGRGGDPALIEAIEEHLKECAVLRSKFLEADAAHEPPWYATSLFESWAIARRSAMDGNISKEVFQEIDTSLWAFINAVLLPSEVERILGVPVPAAREVAEAKDGAKPASVTEVGPDPEPTKPK